MLPFQNDKQRKKLRSFFLRSLQSAVKYYIVNKKENVLIQKGAAHMKKWMAFVFALACIFGMTGCNRLGSGPNKAVFDTTLTTGGAVDELANRPCHDLSSSGPVRVSDYVQNSENFVIPSLVATNSHKITVCNQSGTDVVVCLFSEGESIRQMTVAAHEKGDFDGLTSRFLYAVGIASDEPAQLDITITD